jgi:hypothetical protein
MHIGELYYSTFSGTLGTQARGSDNGVQVGADDSGRRMDCPQPALAHSQRPLAIELRPGEVPLGLQ